MRRGGSFFVSPKLIGVVGTDFPRKYMTLFKKHKVNLKGVKVREEGRFIGPASTT